MVYLDGRKYACQACIKGHRSSSCSHTDRALFEIKKKGRPVTQCQHCRQLRKTKQVHVKCSCEGGSEEKTEPRGISKRKIPTSAAFPDGLKGAAVSTSTSPSPTPQQEQIRSSPNACNCKTSGRCGCSTPVRKPARPRAPSSDDSSGPATPAAPSGGCCGGKKGTNTPAQASHIDDAYPALLLDELARAVQSYSPDPPPHPPVYTSSSAPHYHSGVSSASPPLEGAVAAVYPAPPPFSWPTGVGVGMCSCGVTCACPGCFEHSDPSTALTSSENCPYACTTCSDCNGFGFAAPPENVSNQSWGIGTSGSGVGAFNTWPAPSDSHPVVAPMPPAASEASAFPGSDCCGGSCKCAAQALVCQCAAECCGCCFGCACSDSDDAEDDVQEPLGFAVSGERGSCCAENRRTNTAGECDEGRSRKRRRVEPTDNPHRTIAETSSLFPFLPATSGPNPNADVKTEPPDGIQHGWTSVPEFR